MVMGSLREALIPGTLRGEPVCDQLLLVSESLGEDKDTLDLETP